DTADVRDAGANGDTIQQDSARATLAFAAAVFRPGQIHFVAEDIEKTAFAVDIDGDRAAIDAQIHGISFWCGRIQSSPRISGFLEELHLRPSGGWSGRGNL